MIAQLENQTIGTSTYVIPFLDSGKTAQPLYIEFICKDATTGPMPQCEGQIQKTGNVGDILPHTVFLGFKVPQIAVGKRVVYPVSNYVIGNLNTDTDTIELEITQGNTGDWDINIFGYYS